MYLRSVPTPASSTHPLDDLRGPSRRDLAACAAEWPIVAAEMEVLDAETRLMVAAHRATDLDRRRLRRAHARLDDAHARVANRAAGRLSPKAA